MSALIAVCAWASLLGYAGALLDLILPGKEDERFEGDRLNYRS